MGMRAIIDEETEAQYNREKFLGLCISASNGTESPNNNFQVPTKKAL